MEVRLALNCGILWTAWPQTVSSIPLQKPMSNSAKQSKSSQHIGKCTKSLYTSCKSRVPPPFEGSSRKAAITLTCRNGRS